MASTRNSTYSTHSVADAHLLALLDGKQDINGVGTQGSTLSALIASKLLETVLVVPGISSCKVESNLLGAGTSATSFNDMQKSIHVIGLALPEKSKPSLKRTPESEHIPNDMAIESLFQGTDYESGPQMQYRAPGRGSVAYASKYRQQGCGYRHPTYYGPCGRTSYCGNGGGHGGPQRPQQAYFP